MRDWAAWKLRLLSGLGGFLALTATTRAQSPPPSIENVPPTTPAQYEQLGKITGLGPYHFGMQVDDLPKSDIAPNPKPLHLEANMQVFVDTDTSKVTWGGLHPDQVQLQFYYGKLIAIRLHFHEAYSDLLAVNWAVRGKYGSNHDRMFYTFADGSNIQGSLWEGGTIDDKGRPVPTMQLRVVLPAWIPFGSDDESMTRKTDGEMELFTAGLVNKLGQDHHDTVEQSVLQSHDLDKIKKDL